MISFYGIFTLQLLLLSNFACARRVEDAPVVNETSTPEKELFESQALTQQFLDNNCSKYLVEKEYVILDNGSLLLPVSDSIYEYRTYFLQNDTAFLCAEEKDEEEDKDSTDPIHNFSKEFLSCDHVLIEPHEYDVLKNGSIYIDIYSKVYEPSDFYIQEHGVYVCVPHYEEMKHSISRNATHSGQLSKEDNASTDPIYNFSKEFLSCGHVLIEPHEYDVLKNGNIYIAIYSKVYEPSDFYIQEHGVYVCVPHYEEMKHNMSRNATHSGQLNKFSESFVYVTYAGLMLSIISLLSHLAVFCTVSSVRNLPGCCLASLSLSLLVAYICFVAIGLAETTEHCSSLGMTVYYFFLTSFFWMNAIAFDIWRSFRVVMRELRISSHRVPWRRFLLYSLYSWLVPAALAVLVKTADSTDLLPNEYKPKFGAPLCWFGQRKALLVFFAVPLGIVMLLNAVFFLDVTFVISRAALKTSQSHEATLKKRFFMFMRLALIMGLTWIVGLVAGFADNQFMWYLFVILNTLQGLFIFVVFSCSSKVRGLCCKSFRKRSKARTSTSIRTISQFSAAV